MKEFSSLKERALIVLLNTAIFYGVFKMITGLWLPTSGLESLWFLSAISLWLFSLLSSPWFRPPRDTFANAVTAFILLITADLPKDAPAIDVLQWLRGAGIFWSAVVAVGSFLALVKHDWNILDPWSRLLHRLCETIGRGEIIFTAPALLGILGAFPASPGTLVGLVILWTILIIVRPIELGFTLWRHFKSENLLNAAAPQVGTIERVDHPNIVRVKLTKTDTWKPGQLHIVSMPDGAQKYLLALFSQIQGTDVVGTGICVAEVADRLSCEIGHVHSCHDKALSEQFVDKLSGSPGAEIAGFTVENSSIEAICFEAAEPIALAEGEVVFATISGQQVFYQIVDAHTAEETFDKNPRGTHLVYATQLGAYSKEKGFVKFPWLPTMNMPVFRAANLEFPPTKMSERDFVVGTVPTTNIGVPVNIDDLVTYHSAILGVTGTGKTELSLTLIRETIARGSKGFCVDFTGEYRARLADLNPVFPGLPSAKVSEFEAKLFAVDTGSYGAPQEKKDLEAFLKTVRADVKQSVANFLEKNETGLAILELTELANTRVSLRVTELFLSTVMEWARQHRNARQILIVLEEAHTIIPETFGSGFDTTTQFVVSRIGQIALQGRKYGVGLLIVSQRTALVSKTILSQCNTFFTHALIDQTSLNFLESVYSHRHVKLIPNLRFLEFLAYGKAVRIERPILLKRDFDPEKQSASKALDQPLSAPVEVTEVAP